MLHWKVPEQILYAAVANALVANASPLEIDNSND